MERAAKLKDIAEGDGVDLKAVLIEQFVQRLLLGFADDFFGRNAQNIHRQPFARLAKHGHRIIGRGGLGCRDEVPIVVKKEPFFAFADRPFGGWSAQGRGPMAQKCNRCAKGRDPAENECHGRGNRVVPNVF